MQRASAGHRESPETRTKRTRTGVPSTVAVCPGASVNGCWIGTVGPVGLFSSHAVARRRHTTAPINDFAYIAPLQSTCRADIRFGLERLARIDFAKSFP